MAQPIVLEGVIHGNSITLDERSFLPDGYRVTLHLILTPEEAARLSAGGWADMSQEEVEELEAFLSEMRGRPINLSKGEE